jgi:hypothetical protein
MRHSESASLNSGVTTADSTAEAIETFVSTVTDALAECDAPDATVASVETAGEQLAERVREDQDRRDSERDHAARERAELAGRVSEVEDDVEADETGEEPDVGDANPTGDGSQTGTQTPQTPLGDCVTLPETVADGELTANVKRARDVAADVVDYGRSVPAGYAITSSELRTVLTAMKNDDGRTFTETVSRVMEYLDDLGGDDVTVKETRGGQRTVVFSDEFVRRTVAWRNETASNGVVSGTGATG